MKVTRRKPKIKKWDSLTDAQGYCALPPTPTKRLNTTTQEDTNMNIIAKEQNSTPYMLGILAAEQAYLSHQDTDRLASHDTCLLAALGALKSLREDGELNVYYAMEFNKGVTDYIGLRQGQAIAD